MWEKGVFAPPLPRPMTPSIQASRASPSNWWGPPHPGDTCLWKSHPERTRYLLNPHLHQWKFNRGTAGSKGSSIQSWTITVSGEVARLQVDTGDHVLSPYICGLRFLPTDHRGAVASRCIQSRDFTESKREVQEGERRGWRGRGQLLLSNAFWGQGHTWTLLVLCKLNQLIHVLCWPHRLPHICMPYLQSVKLIC